jgi:PAS domain S-box-containing protein
MDWQYTFYFLTLVADLIVLSLLTIYSFRQRDRLKAIALGLFVLSGAWLACAEILSLLSPTPAAALFWFKLRFVGLAGGPIAWLVFALIYSGRSKWLTTRHLLALSIIPVITQVMIWTNAAHGLWLQHDVEFFQAGPLLIADTTARIPGLWFGVHAAYGFLAILLGVIFMLQTLRARADGLYRRQTVLLLLGTLSVLLLTVPSVLQTTLLGLKFNPTALGMALAAGLIAWAIYQQRFLDLAPVARELLIDAMDDGMLVVDLQNRIIDLNLSLRQMLQARYATLGRELPAQLIGQPLAEVLAQWPQLIELYGNKSSLHTEISIEAQPERFYYDVRITPLTDRHRQLNGRLIVLRDITERKQVEAALRQDEQKYRTLFTESQRQAEELALLEEVRTALAQEIDLADLLRVVVEGIAKTFGYTQVSVYLRQGDVLQLQHLVGYEHPMWEIPITHGVMARSIRTSTSIFLPDVRRDPEFIGAMDGVTSEVCVPLFDQRQAVGALNVESTIGHVLTEDDADLISAVGQHVSIAIGRARLYTELRESERRYKELVDNAREIIYKADPNGIFTFVNPATLRVLGYSQAELIGTRFLDLIRSDYRPAALRFYVRQLRSRIPSTYFEFPAKAKDGSDVWFGQNVQLILNPANSQPVGVQAVTRDITDRKRSDELIRKQNQILQSLHQLAIDISVQLDMPLILQRAMEQAVELLQADRGGGLYLYDATEKVLKLAEGSGLNRGRAGQILKLNEGVAGRVFQTKQPLIVNDYTRWTGRAALQITESSSAVLGVPLLSQGRAIGVLNVFANSELRTFNSADVHLAEMFAAQVAIAIENARLYQQLEAALYSSQARLANVIAIAADAVILVDADRRIRLFNSSAERMFGYCVADVLGQPIDLLLPDRFIAAHTEHIQAFAVSPNPTHDMGKYREAFGKRQDGTVFPIEASIGKLEENHRPIFTIMLRDITEQKRSEEALKRLSHQNELLLDSAGEGILGVDSHGNTIFANPAAARMTGHTVEELIGRHQHIIHHTKIDGTPYRQSECPVYAAFTDGLIHRVVDEVFWRKDGSSFPVEYISTPIREDTELVGAVVVFRDITQRKQSEQEIKQLNQDLEHRARELAALNKANQVIASTLDLNTALKLVIDEVRALLNAEGASVLLYDQPCNELIFTASAGPYAEELVGTRIPATAGIAGWVFQHRQPVQVNQVQSDTRFYNRVDTLTGLTTRSLLAVPLNAERMADSGIIEVINKLDGVFDERDLELVGSMAHSASIAIENARLYQAEQQQREFAETLHEAGATLVATLDVDTVLDRLLEQVSRVVPNDAVNIMLIEGDFIRVARWRGYDRYGAEEFVHNVKFPLMSTANLRHMIETGEPMFIADTQTYPGWLDLPEAKWLRSYAGVPIYVRGEAMGFLNVDSSTIGFFTQRHIQQLRAFADQVAIALENARLYHAQQEQYDRLQQAQAQLIRVEKMTALGRLAATLAHEINNPLQAIQSHLELAIDFPLEAEERIECLRIAYQEIERLNEITRRVLTFARPIAAPTQLANVADLVQQTLALAGKKLQHSHIEVTTDLPPTPPVSVAPNQLVQVFLNLVLNAIESIYDHGRINIALSIEEAQVVVRFANDGPPIPAENLPHIFEPFFSTKQEGTGLGLSTSQSLVEQYGGTLTVENLTDHTGVVFSVKLPCANLTDRSEST